MQAFKLAWAFAAQTSAVAEQAGPTCVSTLEMPPQRESIC